ncbi:MAG: tetratricopeptide repeat protein [Polyangiaceae bacterium]|nr:tetratricopeptide repeat protein [Polyangiaceae bacterium]
MTHAKLRCRRLRVLAALATFVAAACPVDGAFAQECIASKTAQAVLECPETPAQGGRDKPRIAPTTGKPNTVKERKPPKPEAPTDIAIRDGRALTTKSVQLLVAEIQTLETLFSETKKNDPDRPKLARRLAESYVELESAAGRTKIQAQIRAEDAKKKKKDDEAKKERDAAAKADGVNAAARKSAIKYYSLLRSEYPKWCLAPNAKNPASSTGCGDEVLYYLAFEHEAAKQPEEARKVYFDLIENHKTSKYRPQAYLAFGELFFSEAQSDPAKWEPAKAAYEEAAKTPPPGNRAYAYAVYKLGYVHWNLGEHEEAVDAFKKVIEHAGSYPKEAGAAGLANAARRDLVPVYAVWGEPKKAFTFFRPLSGDTGSENEKTYVLLDSLGQAYLDTGHYDEAIALYGDLMGRDKGDRWCSYHAHIVDGVFGRKSSDKDAVVKALNRQFEVEKEFAAGKAPNAAKTKCANLTAAVATETAMAWHIEAQGTGNVRGTGDEKTMKLAAALYQRVVDRFDAEAFASFTFPRILKDDWPTLGKIRFLMADLLFFQKDWEKCGPAFDAVVDADPKGPTAADAAFASAACYQNLYASRHKDKSDQRALGTTSGTPQSLAQKLAPKDFVPEQNGMLKAFRRFVCTAKPAANDTAGIDRLVSVKYARGYTYFEAHHWEEAATVFRSIALEHPDHELGVQAAHRYLEALNVLGTHFPNDANGGGVACFKRLGDDVPALAELYCGEKKRAEDQDCTVLRRVQRDSQWSVADALVREADKNPGTADSLEKYRTAANTYVGLWEKFGKAACEANDKQGCARNDEILYDASRAFQAARLLAKSIAIKKVLINPKYNLHETPSAKKAVYEIGANYQAIAVYDEAAAFYERFAAESSKDEKAPQALSDAVVMRLGLGQKDVALKDAELFARVFTGRGAQAAQVAYAIGAYHADKGDWAAARKQLERDMSSIDKNATLDVKIQAHAALGRAHDKLGSSARAKQEYERVRASWKDPTAAVESIKKVAGDSPNAERRLGKTLEAVGEALFFAAEQKRDVTDRIVFPEYKGSGERKEVEQFIATKVADWQKKKRAAIEDADRSYQEVLKLTPEAPPRWVIAAGSRVGQMKGKFVAQFRAAPIPKEWKQNGPSPYGDLLWEEIRGAYLAELDRVSEPDKLAAKAAYQDCLDRSVKFQYFDEHSRTCEAWLSRTYPAEYHFVDEFRTAPNRVGGGLQERAIAVQPDGSPVVAQVVPGPRGDS